MLKDAGAKEVHLDLLAADRHPYTTGSTCRPEEMIAHGRTVEQIAGELGGLARYLSMEGVYEAISTPAGHHCDAATPATTRSATRRGQASSPSDLAVVPAAR
jgi:glutamine phosphoribosylpyrophosphate amidotransferase